MLDYARRRLRAFVAELDEFTHLEFPYRHSEEALKGLRACFGKELGILDGLAARRDSVTIETACTNALNLVFDYLPLLGFLLRSTNVRNAFEVYGLLLRIAGDVLEPEVPIADRKTRLVLSSEWDYSPFVYTHIPLLAGFVLVGSPAPESANPLVISVAGHELGHAVWKEYDLSGEIRPRIEDEVVNAISKRWPAYQSHFPLVKTVPITGIREDLTARSTWADASKWVLSQAEETFSDFVALRTFGLSYIHAFAYLFCPGPQVHRPLNYPNALKRVGYWERAARLFQLSIPAEGFKHLFREYAEPPLTDERRLLLEIADEAMDQLVDELINKADEIVGRAGIRKGEDHEDQERRIYECYRQVVPAEGCKCLADILNAAWRAAEKGEGLWEDKPQIKARTEEVLKDLVLKNIEIFEIEQILKGG